MSSLSLSLPPPSSRVLDHVKFLRIQCQRLANILELENDQELKQIYVARVHGLFDSIHNLEADASHWLWSWVKPGLRTEYLTQFDEMTVVWEQYMVCSNCGTNSFSISCFVFDLETIGGETTAAWGN
jgi:hypothetical protein